MDISKNLKDGLEFLGDTVSEIASSIAEKNRLRIQLNHIKGLIKADSSTRDQAYIELGRYFYENLREDTTAENEAICAVIDAANERISKASLRYVELLNIQNDTKIRSENAEKLAKAVSEKASAAAQSAKEKGAEAFDKAKASAADYAEKAKASAADYAEKAKASAADFAEKAKITASDLKDKAADKAEDLKVRFDPTKNDDLEDLIAAEQAKIEEAAAARAETAEAAPEIDPAATEESPADAGF